MTKKKVDERIRSLMLNGIKNNHRSLLLIVGNNGQEQVANLHYMLSKAQVAKRPSVLWCYKNKLSLSSHKQKRMKQQIKKKQLGLLDAKRIEEDPFELFLTQTEIRWTHYHETENILGNTYGMLVLQDFEAMTPNILARTIETVQGGGLIIILLSTMTSLRQLSSLGMDAHSKYTSTSSAFEHHRFNERFLLSLAPLTYLNGPSLILDNELTVLQPFAVKGKEFVLEKTETIPLPPPSTTTATSTCKDILGMCRTKDQWDCLKMLKDQFESGFEKQKIISLMAARGRGKSALMGIALASLIKGNTDSDSYNGNGTKNNASSSPYNLIMVTAPSPDNVKTLFQFLFASLEYLDLKEHVDYEIVRGDKDGSHVLRVNFLNFEVSKTIIFIHPEDSHLVSLGHADCLIIDEAAAIPLPRVQQMIEGRQSTDRLSESSMALSAPPKLVMMASTVCGYEGTGRSLSLKLLDKLRTKKNCAGGLVELLLEEPIRYGFGDPLEKWLIDLLCLGCLKSSSAAAGSSNNIKDRLMDSSCSDNGAAGLSVFPAPEDCKLYVVARDTLFSFHKAAEGFLGKMMSLYVSSHYKNSPNDLQMMADAPGQRLYVLLGPPDSTVTLPKIMCVVQVALEGLISQKEVLDSLKRGKRPSGDLIPWTISQQFQDSEFGQLSGCRVVRVAVDPSLQGMGYGSHALKQLELYLSGSIGDPTAEADPENECLDGDDSMENTNISNTTTTTTTNSNEEIKPRKGLPPLLVEVGLRKSLKKGSFAWIGSSYGLTERLARFWSKLRYLPVYLRQTVNEVTGEFSCIMLKTLTSDGDDDGRWLAEFNRDFSKRFISLLSFQFRSLSPTLALDLISSTTTTDTITDGLSIKTKALILKNQISPFDLKRLESYCNNMVDYHIIMDLVPCLANAYFTSLLNGVQEANSRITLSPLQKIILLCVGLQHKSMDDLTKIVSENSGKDLPVSQLLALFIKAVRKITAAYRSAHLLLVDDGVNDGGDVDGDANISDANANDEDDVNQINNARGEYPTTITENVSSATPDSEDDSETIEKERKRELINSLNLKEFAIDSSTPSLKEEWEEEIKKRSGNLEKSRISIKKTVDGGAAASKSKGKKKLLLSQSLHLSKDEDIIRKAKKSKYAKQ